MKFDYSKELFKEGAMVTLKTGVYRLIPHFNFNNSYGFVTFNLFKGEDKVYETDVRTPYLDMDEETQIQASWDEDEQELDITVFEGA